VTVEWAFERAKASEELVQVATQILERAKAQNDVNWAEYRRLKAIEDQRKAKGK
jgi:hypothetical protein